MQGIKASIAERGSLLEWRWTPFFALLTLALVVSLATALIVPATPAQLFSTPELTRSLGKGTIPTQSGIGSTLSADDSEDSNGDSKSATSGATRRGSLQRLADRSRSRARPTPPPRGTAEPVRREIPPAPEPELPQPSNDNEEEEEQAPPDQVDEPLEEDEADPPANGAGGAPSEADSEDEEGPPAPERPKLLNPGVLRTIPGLQRN